MKTTRWRVCVLALLMALAACSKKSEETGSEGTDNAQALAELAASGAEVSGNRVDPKDLGALVDFIVAEASDLPRAEFDPAALAAKLGKDPQAHFEWVRDHTWWAPYRGLLRGPKGVMLDRLGSNLDRAVLLGDLMRRSGRTIRLAHANLPESRARELLENQRQVPERPRGVVGQGKVSIERQRAVDAVMRGQRKAAEEAAANARHRTADANLLVRAISDQLLATMEDAFRLRADGKRQAILAMQDHWWVEYQDNGRWIAADLQSTEPDAGSPVTAAFATSEWKLTDEMPSIPSDDWHSVDLKVVIERYQDGSTTETQVMDASLRPAEVIDQSITFAHMPKPWPDALPGPDSDPNALGNAAVSVREWIPFLRVGGTLIVQSGFTDNGDVISDPLDPKRDIAATGGAGFMTGFGEALGGDVAAASTLTAEWIDYEIHVPGASPRRVRRTVFDVLGPTNRSNKAAEFDGNANDLLIRRYEALLSRTDILLQACDFTNDFVAHLASAGIVANQGQLRKLSTEREAGVLHDLATGILNKLQVWGPLPRLVMWRSVLATPGGDWFVDRPDVLNYRIGRSAVNADRMAIWELIDVASNETGVQTGSDGEAFSLRMRRGVADTVAEILALGGDLRTTENTASLFAIAGNDPEHAIFIKSHDVSAVQRLGWSEDVTALLAENVGAGFAAIVPKEPVMLDGRERVGWWRINPEDGSTIGVMDTGFNSAPEYTEVQLQRMRLAEWLWHPERWRDYQTLRRMAMENSFQMSEADVAAYNLYMAVETAMRNLLWLSWL